MVEAKQLEFKIGLDVIRSYRRLSYTPWHAIAEFVDNSTQSYANNKKALDLAYKEEKKGLEVSIVYDRKERGGLLRIFDNAGGMDLKEIENAMHLAKEPKIRSGRSKYGMGLKTAAAWVGNKWLIRTKKLGSTKEYEINIDVEKIAKGNSDLRTMERPKEKSAHYTLVEITDLNREFRGQTLGKISDFLRSMYRVDIREGVLTLEWRGKKLEWQDPEFRKARDGSEYKRDFSFEIDGKKVTGWAGILLKGSRKDAGFSIFSAKRVIRGWPNSWRPSSLYGQFQGSNDLVNQRLVGEINLDDFMVSNTKDEIIWHSNQEELVEEKLLELFSDYKETAKTSTKDDEDERGPSQVEVDVAISEIQEELQSPEMIDRIQIEDIPPEEVYKKAKEKIIDQVVEQVAETFSAKVGDLTVKVFLANDMSFSDPYVVSQSTQDSEGLVIINTSHPHWKFLKASEGVANYLRHCIYDAISEWQAKKRTQKLDPDTIKIIKDGLLRVTFEIERHTE